MFSARVARVLVIVTALCACNSREEPDGPVLPDIDLASTTVGLPYEVRLTASGGVAPLRYSIGDVPDGFSFYSATALLTGPARSEGDYTLTVEAIDATGAKDSRSYELKVYAAPAITSTALPRASAGQAYDVQLSATGGRPPLRWSLADGSLPGSLSLSSEGRLSGVPQGLGGHPVTLRVQDANGALSARSFTLQVGFDSTDGGTSDGGIPDGGTTDGGVPDAGTPFPLEVANWNIEWFGSITNGPTNEQLQLTNVRTVINDIGADIWGVAEIVDTNHFNALKAELSGFGGFLANDPTVLNGSANYSTGEQKVGVLFKSSLVSVQKAEVILSGNSGDFAGRPPLRVDLRVTRDERSLDLVVIVLHMKADTNQSDYNQRMAAGAALKQYLDTQLPSSRVIVLGDWNDDVDVSIARGPDQNYLPSPYQNYVDAPVEYTFITRPLSLAGMGSSVGFDNVIDHQLVTNELAVNYVTNSATIVRPNIPSYGTTTSDHYPVVSNFDFSRVLPPPTPPSSVFINEFLPHPNINPSTGQIDFDQQFVEVVNTGSTTVDLGGWKLHDAESYSGTKPARHVFAAGTTLAPGKGYVVFSGASAVPSGWLNATYSNGGEGLRFNRGVNVGSNGDTVYLARPDATVADSYYYRDTYQGVSYNRSPDATTTGSWVRHDSLPSGTSASPGKRASGTDF
ncbi:putative Ig domain-containing protein [Hyalangium gracile]|uniref:putative Ig domain-containing protein n=1 Tax=Hyalangium gracile TaxID=394092 RepID=UPI001CCE6593|nr:lamin tail domain-containing protein [Hyalangium gracile]